MRELCYNEWPVHKLSKKILAARPKSESDLDFRGSEKFGLRFTPLVCTQAFSPLEPEWLVRSGRGRHRLTRRNGGQTMVPISERPVPIVTSNRKPLQKSIGNSYRPNQCKWTDSAQAWWAYLQPPWVGTCFCGRPRWRLLGTTERQVNSDL